MNGTASPSTRQVSAAGSTSTATSATSATAEAASVSRSRASSRFQRACSAAAPSASASASSGMRATVPSCDAPDRGRARTAARALRRAAPLRWEGEMSPEEFTLAGSSPERRHDVTFFVLDPAGRLALIQKPSYPQGVWRPPGGGVRPGERFETGVEREALRGARAPDRARALPRQLRGDLPLRRRRARLAHTRLLGAHRRGASCDRSTRTRSAPPAGARPTSSPARSARGCSRPAARSGATGSRCTTRR